MSLERLAWLDARAALHQVADMGGDVVAFVLALREGSDYDSANYRWFAQRVESFLYVDRVVVAATCHGQGIGRALYEQVFRYAAQARVPVVACEFDLVPPNPESERFHRRFGFSEVGRQAVAGGKKQVSLQIARVSL